MGSGSPESSGWSQGSRRTLIWSIVLAVVAYLAISLWGGWQAVLQAATRVGLGGILIALCLSLMNYGLRFVRWQFYLSALGHRIPIIPSLQIYLAGFALTTTPGKAGEMLRSVFLSRYGIGYAQSVAAFLSERLSDLIAVLIILLPGIAVYPRARLVLAVLVICIGAVLFVIHRRTWLVRIRGFVEKRYTGRMARLGLGLVDVVQHSSELYRWALLAWGLILAIVAWSAEAYAFHLMLGWIGQPLSLETSVFIYAFAMVVGAVSFLPGGLGSAEFTMITLLSLSRVGMAEAIAVTVLIRVTTLWFAVLIGLFALMTHRHH